MGPCHGPLRWLHKSGENMKVPFAVPECGDEEISEAIFNF